jgi:hypothetical protein
VEGLLRDYPFLVPDVSLAHAPPMPYALSVIYGCASPESAQEAVKQRDLSVWQSTHATVVQSPGSTPTSPALAVASSGPQNLGAFQLNTAAPNVAAATDGGVAALPQTAAFHRIFQVITIAFKTEIVQLIASKVESLDSMKKTLATDRTPLTFQRLATLQTHLEALKELGASFTVLVLDPATALDAAVHSCIRAFALLSACSRSSASLVGYIRSVRVCAQSCGQKALSDQVFNTYEAEKIMSLPAVDEEDLRKLSRCTANALGFMWLPVPSRSSHLLPSSRETWTCMNLIAASSLPITLLIQTNDLHRKWSLY